MLRKPGRANGRWTQALGAAAAVLVAVAASGCGAAFVEGDTASVLLVVNNVNEGTPLLSDVRGANGLIVNCQTTARLSARPKNPTSPVGSPEDVRVSRYSVSYRRSDGRGVEGLDIPYTFSGSTTLVVPSGTQNSAEITVDLVRHQAKLEPPLINIVGVQVVTMSAEITFFGETISRKAVQAKGTVQVTFADFADGTATCEGN
jgi:hypothetical protein